MPTTPVENFRESESPNSATFLDVFLEKQLHLIQENPAASLTVRTNNNFVDDRQAVPNANYYIPRDDIVSESGDHNEASDNAANENKNINDHKTGNSSKSILAMLCCKNNCECNCCDLETQTNAANESGPSDQAMMINTNLEENLLAQGEGESPTPPPGFERARLPSNQSSLQPDDDNYEMISPFNTNLYERTYLDETILVKRQNKLATFFTGCCDKGGACDCCEQDAAAQQASPQRSQM